MKDGGTQTLQLAISMQGKAETQYKGINWEFIPDGSPHSVYKSE